MTIIKYEQPDESLEYLSVFIRLCKILLRLLLKRWLTILEMHLVFFFVYLRFFWLYWYSPFIPYFHMRIELNSVKTWTFFIKLKTILSLWSLIILEIKLIFNQRKTLVKNWFFNFFMIHKTQTGKAISQSPNMNWKINNFSLFFKTF